VTEPALAPRDHLVKTPKGNVFVREIPGGDLEVPVSIIFGGSDRYLHTSLARRIAGLFTDPSLHVVPDASHWPQHDQPQLVADLLAAIAGTQSRR
jgi:pimeloyl-ACP methyl ester carboxylesterase